MAKLVEILARELKEWPSCEEIFQDYDGELRYIGHVESSLSGVRVDLCDDLLRGKYQDTPLNCVTRAEWQAAVDALKPDAQRFAEDYIEANRDRHAEEWNGEGLPPVGTTCDLVYQGCEQGQVKALFCSRQTTVCLNLEDGREQFGETIDYEFRPIRTPEQIAAEEREAGINEIRQVLASAARGSVESVIWDAGYRKQEPK